MRNSVVSSRFDLGDPIHYCSEVGKNSLAITSRLEVPQTFMLCDARCLPLV